MKVAHFKWPVFWQGQLSSILPFYQSQSTNIRKQSHKSHIPPQRKPCKMLLSQVPFINLIIHMDKLVWCVIINEHYTLLKLARLSSKHAMFQGPWLLWRGSVRPGFRGPFLRLLRPKMPDVAWALRKSCDESCGVFNVLAPITVREEVKVITAIFPE